MCYIYSYCGSVSQMSRGVKLGPRRMDTSGQKRISAYWAHHPREWCANFQPRPSRCHLAAWSVLARNVLPLGVPWEEAHDCDWAAQDSAETSRWSGCPSSRLPSECPPEDPRSSTHRACGSFRTNTAHGLSTGPRTHDPLEHTPRSEEGRDQQIQQQTCPKIRCARWFVASSWHSRRNPHRGLHTG